MRMLKRRLKARDVEISVTSVETGKVVLRSNAYTLAKTERTHPYAFINGPFELDIKHVPSRKKI